MTRIKISRVSEMILLDKIQIGIILLMVSVFVLLIYRQVRKDPDLWLTPKVWDAPRMWCREVWAFVWKLQPEKNVSLQGRRKKQMGKGWVVAVTIFMSMLALIYIGTKDIVEVLIIFAVIIYIWLLIRWMRQKAGDYFHWNGFKGEPREKDQGRK